MSITLCFDPAVGDEPSGNLWVPTPDDMDSKTASLRAVPFAASLMGLPANMTSIMVNEIG